MEPAIKINNISKIYGVLKAVDNISLDIKKGEILGLLGPNGAGKTTLIHILCGLLEPTNGEIQFKDNKIRKDLNTLIGVCPQENIFWPKLTCKEQLQFMGAMYNMSPRVIKDRTKMLLEFLGLSEKANVLAKKLSGGMKRRLSICLALVHDPKLLILDEPEAGLDPQSRILVRKFIRSLTPSKTVILSTHNMDEADRMSDKVAILNRGKLLVLDTPENLKRSIGEGDQLEIILNREIGIKKEIIQKEFDEFSTFAIIGQSIQLKSKNIIEHIPLISRKLNSHGFEIRKMTLRENTLEDVFIHLTGEKLMAV